MAGGAALMPGRSVGLLAAPATTAIAPGPRRRLARGKLLARVLLALPWLLVFWMALGPGPARAQTAVAVPSLDRPQGPALLLPGWWFAAPAAASKQPAVLLLHGCGGPRETRGDGLSPRLREYAVLLQSWGVQALVVDSFAPRGERELCTQNMGARAITQVHRRRDVLGALQWLAQQPGVDASRLGLLGFSHGGSAVLAATNLRHAEVRSAPQHARAAIAFYPGCGAERDRGHVPSGKLLLLVGEADDWTPAASCRELAADHADIQFESYAGAFHGFDGPGPVRLRRDVPNGVNPGQGVHVGGHPAAREASRQRLERFVRETLLAP